MNCLFPRAIALCAFFLAPGCCPEDQEGEPTDPREKAAPHDPNLNLGMEPVHVCLDLSPGPLAVNEVGSIHLRYKVDCDPSVDVEPCLEAQVSSGATPGWQELDRARHRTLVPIVYRSTTQVGGDVPIQVDGPPGTRFQVEWAVNEADPEHWSDPVVVEPDRSWTPTPSPDFDVGRRHFAAFRVKVAVEKAPAGSGTYINSADPLVILVPKRVEQACSVNDPYYSWPG